MNGLFLDPGINGYQDWQASRFSWSDLADPKVSGPEADPDHDQDSNWAEFHLGRDPQFREPQPALWLTQTPEGALLHVLVRRDIKSKGLRHPRAEENTGTVIRILER